MAINEDILASSAAFCKPGAHALIVGVFCMQPAYSETIFLRLGQFSCSCLACSLHIRYPARKHSQALCCSCCNPCLMPVL
jgi:hypothetical protein